jgi:ATP synthase F1 gamma subunit
MASIYDIKKKIQILSLFKKATNAMKLVALSSYHKLKKVIPGYRKEFLFNSQLIENFFEKTETTKVLHVFIGSNRGLCGDYNIAMAKHFLSIKKKYQGEKETHYFIFGKMLATKINSEIDRITLFYEKAPRIEQIDSLISFFYAFVANKNIEHIVFHYTASEGFGKKEIKSISTTLNHEAYHVKSSFKITEELGNAAMADFLYYYFASVISYVFYESLFSENAIRFITMDSSYQNAEESLTQTKKLYFKQRQEKINTELGDLVGALL